MNNTKYLVRSGLLLGLAIVFQFVGRNFPQINQFLVGPLINAILLTSTFLCGTLWGVVIGALTPVTAFVLGQLNAAFGPFIPFIIVGNALIIISFGLLKKYKTGGRVAGVLIGSFLKYSFLALAAGKLIHLFNMGFSPKVEKMLEKAMGTTQLVTSLIGGAIALILIEAIKNKINTED